MAGFSDLCSMYGQSAGDPDAIDNIIEMVHEENVQGLLDALNADMITMDDAELEARDIGYESLAEFLAENKE